MAFRPERLDLISICTGGGGLDLGVELAIPCARSVVLVEREGFAAAQLVSAMQQGLMAPAPLWSDARTFDGRAWRGCVDGLIGGIPCQPHSLAGKRLERADPRDLWSTARRIIVQSGACSSSLRMSKGCSAAAEPSGFTETWADLVSRVRSDCSRRLRSARAISGDEPSSSAWPTPATRDYKGANSPDHLENGTGRKHLDQLPNFVEHMWSTPRASDGEKGGPNQSFGAGGMPLPSQAVDMAAYIDRNVWPTPTAMNRPRSEETLEKARAVRKQNAGQNTVPLYLEDVASRISLQGQETSLDGEKSSPDRRSLNPLFVEWLMGWPPGWTLLAWTDFACSATELSRWKQRMRSALSQLGLPQEAPPAQLALFA